ncbi:EAL domain-containing protein [Aliterella atlantica]|uniref:Diguanylate cyclase n=1 Tax=Aliterella atlantica CENA595 TaxID=1618023 RepID=A0A0D8ZQM5_9CYAN|nr:EAL domain-containing protein [Aliterella atlantica]KJH71035.1 diguanylate cyclase [Aliterella atlantica CENA595]
MTLRKKTLLLISITLSCLIAVMYVTSTTLLMKGFERVEVQSTRENVQRVVDAYNEKLTKLSLMNEDWAEWDSTYRFIENRNSTYIQENLIDAALQRINVNLIAYVSNERQLVFGSLSDDNQHSRLIPQVLQSYITNNDVLLQKNQQQGGIILLPHGPMLISRRDILTSAGIGPRRGTLIMGRYLNIAQLAQQTHFHISLYGYDSSQIPPDFQLAHQALASDSTPFVQPLNENAIAGYTLLKDVDGKPAILLRVQMPRAVYKQGKVSMRYVGTLLFAVGLVFSTVTLLLLEKLVLSRLARLSNGVSIVGASGNLSARVIASGKDELAHLADNINSMLRQLQKSQQNLQSSEERYRVFLAQSSEGIWRCELECPIAINSSKKEQIYYLNNHTYLAECNDIYAQMMGYSCAQDIVGIKITNLYPKLPLQQLIQNFIESGYRLDNAESYFIDKHGNKKVFFKNIVGIIENDCLVRVWGIQRDITDLIIAQEALIKTQVTEVVNLQLTNEIEQRKRVEQALFQEKELAQITLQSIGDAVITTNADNIIKSINPVAEKITNWRFEEAIGLPLQEVFKIVDETTGAPVTNFIEQSLCGERASNYSHHILLIANNGTEFAIDYCAAPIYNSDRSFIGNVLIFRDVTQSRRLSHQLSWQASHDPLTQLYNRSQFEQFLQAAVASTQTQLQEHTLCYLDLDRFKIVNDTCGHLAGDRLLCQISEIFQKELRKTDVLARLGGDEFGIILYQCSLEEAYKIAENLRSRIEDFRFVWQDKTFALGVSIGIVAINSTTQNLISLLGAADAACYAAKNQGRNQIHIYQIDDSQLAKQQGEMQWVSIIPQAIAENKFKLYCQKIMPIQSKDAIEHWEILLRLEDETGKIISPMAFIPAAERYNLMHLIDRWVISTLFAYLQRQNNLDIHHRLYSINLSGASINDHNFISFVQEQFVKYNISPAIICFEVTETVAITNLTKAAQFIQELKALGCQFSLDDFGSGMSSFAYLKNLPVDYVKVDGIFIKEVVNDEIASAMVEAIVRLAGVMEIQTVAEFVENKEIIAKIQELGIDYAQGYGIARPSPLEITLDSKLATSAGVLQLKSICI